MSEEMSELESVLGTKIVFTEKIPPQRKFLAYEEGSKVPIGVWDHFVKGTLPLHVVVDKADTTWLGLGTGAHTNLKTAINSYRPDIEFFEERKNHIEAIPEDGVIQGFSHYGEIDGRSIEACQKVVAMIPDKRKSPHLSIWTVESGSQNLSRQRFDLNTGRYLNLVAGNPQEYNLKSNEKSIYPVRSRYGRYFYVESESVYKD